MGFGDGTLNYCIDIYLNIWFKWDIENETIEHAIEFRCYDDLGRNN